AYMTSPITPPTHTPRLWSISCLTSSPSAILANPTTSFVMVPLIRKLIHDTEMRLTFAGMIVIAATAGGAWTPIGDVTTTMLWIGGQVSTSAIVTSLFIPSLICLLVPVLFLGFRLKGKKIGRAHV